MILYEMAYTLIGCVIYIRLNKELRYFCNLFPDIKILTKTKKFKHSNLFYKKF